MSWGGSAAKYQRLREPGEQAIADQQMQWLLEILQGGAGSQGFQSFFGGLGSPATPLQRQATGGISQFLNQPAPELQALNLAGGAIGPILRGKPGEGVISALEPSFGRNLAAANQPGARFSSGNMMLRQKALEDWDLLAANAAQQGQQTQLQAAQTYGALASAAGQGPFNRLTQAYGIGQGEAQQADLETQRRLQLLAGLLGVGQGVAFNAPWAQTQQAGAGRGQQAIQLLAMILPYLLQMGNPFGGRGGSTGTGSGGPMIGPQ